MTDYDLVLKLMNFCKVPVYRISEIVSKMQVFIKKLHIYVLSKNAQKLALMITPGHHNKKLVNLYYHDCGQKYDYSIIPYILVSLVTISFYI